MRKIAGIIVVLLFCTTVTQAQDNGRRKTQDSLSARIDTIKPAGYINVGKIAARRAVIQSAIVPGLGQLKNKVTFWSVGKVIGIYGGFVALTLSYQDNNKNYHIFLEELTYRQEHNDQSPPGSVYSGYPTSGLYTAKDTYRRNREVIIFSYVGVYLLNLVDAYVSTRLKYWSVTENISFQVKPGIINTNSGLARNNTIPALKLALTL